MDRQQLLAQAKRVTSNASRKQSRFRKLNGVSLPHDPSVSLERIKRYTNKQLSSYIERVNSFNKTRYVRGSQFGEPIRANVANAYETLRRQFNKRIEVAATKLYASPGPAGDIRTTGEYLAENRPSFTTTMGGGGWQNPLKQEKITVDKILGESGVQLMVKKLIAKSRNIYEVENKTHRNNRWVGEYMVQALGDKKLYERFKKLSDANTYKLMYAGRFFDIVSIKYQVATGVVSGDAYDNASEIEQLNDEIDKLLGE